MKRMRLRQRQVARPVRSFGARLQVQIGRRLRLCGALWVRSQPRPTGDKGRVSAKQPATFTEPAGDAHRDGNGVAAGEME